jgi:two-component system, LytTR family, sensor kinase
MIKDRLLRLIFIPLLGILIPFISGIITYRLYSAFEIILANLFFVLLSLSIWRGCHWIHLKLRPLFTIRNNPFLKVLAICVLVTIYGTAISGIYSFIWFKISKDTFNWQSMTKLVAFSSLSVIVFALIYEILFLSKERELDTQIVSQLDKEVSQAEMTILKHEMDPHFLFNALNTLSFLIRDNPDKAHRFNRELAEVYKYFLVNKNKELISLSEELRFIESYFYLLKIRYEEKIFLENKIRDSTRTDTLIPPCAIQVLMENAIKHSHYSEDKPLVIQMTQDDQFLKITNNIPMKNNSADSTQTGLKNLNSRYHLICHTSISIEKTEDHFSVQLPIIHKT